MECAGTRESSVWTGRPTYGCRGIIDEDTRALIRQLCTRAGMIMEDASAVAVLAPQELHVDELRRAAGQIVALLAAAEALRGE